eukprot:g6010.t1
MSARPKKRAKTCRNVAPSGIPAAATAATAATAASSGASGGSGDTGRVVFVLAPSAGGTPPKAVLRLLQGLGRVVPLPGTGRWSGSQFGSAKNQDKLLTVLEDTCEAAASCARPQRVVLACTSFGCRVAARLFGSGASDANRARRDALVARGALCHALLLFGFPLHGPDKQQDRAAVLRELPPAVAVQLVSGEKDEFLVDESGTAGVDVLRGAVATMQAPHSVGVHATSGRHDPLAVGKAERAPTVAAVDACVKAFVERVTVISHKTTCVN